MSLSRHAQSIIRDARPFEDGVPEDKARIRDALLQKLSAGMASSSSSVHVAVSKGLPAVLKGTLAVMTLGSLVAIGTLVTRKTQIHERSDDEVQVARTQPTVTVKKLYVPSVAKLALPQKKHDSVPLSVAAHEPHEVVTPCALSDEVKVLRNARELLTNTPKKSLEAIEHYTENCPSGALNDEMQALKKVAQCKLKLGVSENDAATVSENWRTWVESECRQ